MATVNGYCYAKAKTWRNRKLNWVCVVQTVHRLSAVLKRVQKLLFSRPQKVRQQADTGHSNK